MKSDAKQPANANGNETSSGGGKAQKNKTVLIVALLGCGGLLLLGCCAGGGFGGWYFWGRSPTPNKDGVAKVKDKADKVTGKTDQGGLRYKSLYDKIQLGVNDKQIVALTGSRGERITPSGMPNVTDKSRDALMAKSIRENGVSLLFRWQDPDGELVIGYDSADIAIFKAYFHPENNQDLVEYKIEKSAGKK